MPKNFIRLAAAAVLILALLAALPALARCLDDDCRPVRYAPPTIVRSAPLAEATGTPVIAITAMPSTAVYPTPAPILIEQPGSAICCIVTPRSGR